jgi:hypothetical protein
VYCSDVALPRPDPTYVPNKVLGVLKRFGTKPYPANFDKRKLRRFVRGWCEKNLTPLDPEVDLSFETWVKNTPYTADRKAELAREWTIRNTGDSVNQKHVKIKSFIKDEPYEEPKACRIINSREDYFKCYSGPLFQLISDHVFSHDWFIKTMPVKDRPDAIFNGLFREGSSVVCTDFTSMEAHFTREYFELIENTMYRYMCKNNQRALAIMNDIIKVLTGDNYLQFNDLFVKVNATRMSGEMNTSLGNGFANLMLFLYACHDRKCGEVSGFVEGDDGIFVVDIPENLPDEEYYKRMGWRIKIVVVDELNKASFCGMVFDPVDRVVVADPMKHIANLGWCPKRYVNAGRAVRLQLLRSKGLSLAHQYNGCPILSALGRRIVQITEDVRIRKSVVESMDLYHRVLYRSYLNDPLPDELPVKDNTRQLVYELYGIDPDSQKMIEEGFAGLCLDSCFSISVPFPDVWRENFRRFSVPADVNWFPDTPLEEEVSQLEAIGKHQAAQQFLSSYRQ